MKELISSGIELMFAGMSIVYAFLIMLVFTINLMSAFLQRYFPDKTVSSGKAYVGLDKSTVAAITAAVHQYRKQHR
jgi:oxaloacetate decarboxylase (Na+ extruding) subunit gamma